MKWSEDEIDLLIESLELGNTYKEISDFILEDFGYNRSEVSIRSKASKLGIKSLNNVRKNITTFVSEVQILNKNIKVLSTNYINNKTNLDYICKVDGYTWSATPDNILRGHGCPKCAKVPKVTTENFIKDIKDINPDISILSTYVNAHSKIKCYCKICEHTWYTEPNSLKNNKGCPECANRNQLGGYGRMSKEVANKIQYPIYLYHVKLQFEDEIFYKYGSTSRLNKQRFKEYKPYILIEEISFIKYDAWTAICKEKELKSNYTPEYKFGGWTECYTKE